MRVADGWLAVNMARPEDISSVPAWLAGSEPAGPVDREHLWSVIERACEGRAAGPLVEQARLLGLPIAVARDRSAASQFEDDRSLLRFIRPEGAQGRKPTSFRVVDLSSLWAGPLCARILGLAGAEVTKVESEERPDGARLGPPAFYELLHAGQREVRLPFRTERGRAQLLALLEDADVVIEASRPRALRQLGIDAASLVARRPGLVWISLTAYGREGSDADRVGFGDDVAAAAGLLDWVDDEPRFVGDAIADPIAGIAAALGGLAARLGGGGYLVDVTMRDAAGFVAAAPEVRR